MRVVKSERNSDITLLSSDKPPQNSCIDILNPGILFAQSDFAPFSKNLILFKNLPNGDLSDVNSSSHCLNNPPVIIGAVLPICPLTAKGTSASFETFGLVSCPVFNSCCRADSKLSLKPSCLPCTMIVLSNTHEASGSSEFCGCLSIMTAATNLSGLLVAAGYKEMSSILSNLVLGFLSRYSNTMSALSGCMNTSSFSSLRYANTGIQR